MLPDPYTARGHPTHGADKPNARASTTRIQTGLTTGLARAHDAENIEPAHITPTGPAKAHDAENNAHR